MTTVDTTTGEILEPTPSRLAAALARFQANLPVVTKSRTVTVTGKDGRSGYSYGYAGLSDIVEVVYPRLAAEGLSFACLPSHGALGYELVGALMHESGERLVAVFPLYGNSPQQIGSSISYGRRYLLSCLCGVTTADDDDDGQAASQAQGRTQGQAGRRDQYETSPQRAERVKGTPDDDKWYTDAPAVPDGPAPVSGGAPAAPPIASPEQNPRQEPTVDARTPGGAKKSQVQALLIKFRALGVEDKEERLTRTRAIVGRDIGSANDLTEAEVLRALDVLEADLLAKQDPR